LKQVSTSLTGPLYTTSANIGDQWAANMRAAYGLGPPTDQVQPSWEAKYLGPGALAMQSQAAQGQLASGQDPQVLAAMRNVGSGYTSLGQDPFQVAQSLGQQYRAPLGQLERGQQFTTGLLKQWQPPNLRLTGEDLLNVAMQQQAQNAAAQQAAFEAQLQGATATAQSQAAMSAAGIGALGSLGGAAVKGFTSPALTPSGYFQSPLGLLFSGGANASPPVDVAPGGGTFPVDMFGNAIGTGAGYQGGGGTPMFGG
jgi:hypothetical protein